MTNFQSLDFNLLSQIYKITHNGVFDKIMPSISSLGNIGIIWIVISIFLLFNKEYRKVGILCLVALVLTAIVGEVILKNFIGRLRPFNEVPTMQLLITKPLSYSFPSGHTASSFAAAFIISSQIKKLAIPVYALAMTIAFSRMYLFVHYPSDIIGGILLGIICAKIVLLVNKRYFRKEM